MRKYTLPPTNPYAPSTHTNVHPVLTPQWADRTDDFDVATAVLRCLHPNTPSTTPTTTPVSSPERPRMAPDPRAAEEQEDILEAEEEGVGDLMEEDDEEEQEAEPNPYANIYKTGKSRRRSQR